MESQVSAAAGPIGLRGSGGQSPGKLSRDPEARGAGACAVESIIGAGYYDWRQQRHL